MLQQTQVTRVLPKYHEFLSAFPTVATLAGASVADVLSVWQGLGYNRRALALQRAARIITTEHNASVPQTVDALRRLPGVGPATAAAVCVFAYDLPLPFIETNIRAAFIHFFFQESVSVADAAILPLVKTTMDSDNPREWCYALMDCGAWLKKHHPNPSRRGRHHTVQTPFAGSHRQLRAAVLRVLLSAAPAALSAEDVHATSPQLGAGLAEITAVLKELACEGFLARTDERYGMA